MKKIFKLLLIVLLGVFVVGVSSCQDTTEDNQTGSSSSQTGGSNSQTGGSSSVDYTIKPSATYVINCLKSLTEVGEVQSKIVNNPTGILNEIYFELNMVDQTEFSETTVSEKGTACGGCIEVFSTASYANERNTYLKEFDDTIFDSGSHKVVGTCVIRISCELSDSVQQSITNKIINELKNHN